jgi:hypothetical protein
MSSSMRGSLALAAAIATLAVLGNAPAQAKFGGGHSSSHETTVKKTPTPGGPVPMPYPNVSAKTKHPAGLLRGNSTGNRKGGRYLAQ